ncbi:MAG TPA: hypothetical protein VEB86_06040, partial [Chryseosolibacter sp.]|nr:hypothetical protein [Chryseosolibacter sp.]
MRYILMLQLLAVSILAFGQEENPEAPVTQSRPVTVNSFTAQFLVSTNLEGFYLNIVGAGIRYTRKHTSVSITIFPSLSFRKDRRDVPADQKKPFVRPGFAVGPLFQYRKLMLGFPTFYQDDGWH